MSAPGFAGKSRIVDLNASTGAFIPLLATTVCRRLRVEESPLKADGSANTLIGLIQYQIPNDGTANGFTTIFEASGVVAANIGANPGVAAFELGNVVAQRDVYGEILGNGPDTPGAGAPPIPATTLCNLRSGGAATSVRVVEYN